MATDEVRAYWSRLVEQGCLITGKPAEIAHAHGPSLTARGFAKQKGKKHPAHDWLVLPLSPEEHRLLSGSMDNAMASWERRNGTQADWLDFICALMGVDVWAKAREALRS